MYVCMYVYIYIYIYIYMCIYIYIYINSNSNTYHYDCSPLLESGAPAVMGGMPRPPDMPFAPVYVYCCLPI